LLKLDKVLRTRFILNDEPIYTCEPKEILQAVFGSVPDITFWSSEALREFVIGTFGMINEFGVHVKQELKLINSAVTGDVSRQFSKFSTWTKKAAKFIPRDRDKLINYIYDMILSCEGKGLLPHFGMTNKHQDNLNRNPEKVTICELPLEIPKRSKTQ
jgi:hypothetical protein